MNEYGPLETLDLNKDQKQIYSNQTSNLAWKQKWNKLQDQNCKDKCLKNPKCHAYEDWASGFYHGGQCLLFNSSLT